MRSVTIAARWLAAPLALTTSLSGVLAQVNNVGSPAFAPYQAQGNGATSSASSAVRAGHVFDVKADFGAIGDGTVDDADAMQAAFNAAAAVHGTVFLPQGHYLINSQLNIPDGLTIEGVGRPSQFVVGGQWGSILDFRNLGAGVAGLTSSMSQTTQFVNLRYFQVERAAGACIDVAFAFFSIEGVTADSCGGGGLILEGNNTVASYMGTIKNSQFNRSLFGIKLNGTAIGSITTITLEGSYAQFNTNQGIICNYCTTTSFIGSSADYNGAEGHLIFNSQQVSFINEDGEFNQGNQSIWSGSQGMILGSRASLNNQALNASWGNGPLIANGSNVEMYNYRDAAMYSGNTVSMTVINSSTLRLRNSTLLGSLNPDSTSQVLTDPQIIGNTAVPFIYPGSGSVGNNCAITGLPTLPTTYSAAYIYLPANGIKSGSAAGWYYFVGSSATAGTCYQQTYTQGIPSVPPSPSAWSSTGPGSFTNATGTYQASYAVNVVRNSMGKNGRLSIEGVTTNTSSGNNKATEVTFGSMTIGPQAQTTNVNFPFFATLSNNGSASSQSASFGQTMYATASTSALARGSVDTTQNQTVTVKLELQATTDSIVLESANITLYQRF